MRPLAASSERGISRVCAILHEEKKDARIHRPKVAVNSTDQAVRIWACVERPSWGSAQPRDILG